LHAIHAAHAWGLLGISQSGKDLLYPGAQELIIGAIAFFALFAFMAKWVLPKANSVLTERQAKIQGELEKAEEAKKSADALLAQYRESLTGAKEESNRIIEDARKTAESLRLDLQRKAEEESKQIVARAQEEIRSERDRVFQELKAQVGELSLQLAGRVIGESLDRDRHMKLIDAYITDVGSLSTPPSGNRHGSNGDQAGGSGSGSESGE
jgi:F-type H+-transporting ATPase subunit b